ncbi:MAG: hypothetical protein QXT63_07400 [Thermoplasmata archaeon]
MGLKMLTKAQSRLLYLISLYSKPSKNESENVIWIREMPLRVMMHEGIERKIFDWDYAPASVMLSDGRKFVNISQEGEDDLNDLRELGLINALKLSTSRYYFITAYCVTEKGLEELKKISIEDKQAIDSLVRCQCGGLLKTVEKEGVIKIKCGNCNYEKESNILDVEDVSYISKPYMPKQPNISKHRGV